MIDAYCANAQCGLAYVFQSFLADCVVCGSPTVVRHLEPPAEISQGLKVNINQMATVKLTAVGLECFRRSRYRGSLREGKTAMVTCELWMLFEIFGGVMRFEDKAPFEGCEIEIHERTA